ncbi:TIGR04255 family protein [Providencia sp. PROV032]|uniref:TIGR04255 family protein n=1 Tax=Providencia sp. PROV032 TaxID=2949764 RepID=UPI0023490154|nr:TIGR04255 family protein [Providencia sp. PROV032]
MDDYGLVYMLVKVEFGRIPDSVFLEKIGHFAHNLRKDYITAPMMHIKAFKMNMNVINNGQPEVTHFEVPMVTLLSPNKDYGVRVAPDFFVVHTRKYQNYSDISERVKKILYSLIEQFDISFYSFLGMRYVNKIKYDNEYEFSKEITRSEFLQPRVCDWPRAGSNMLSNYLDMSTGVAVTLNTGIVIDSDILPPELMEVASDIITQPKVLQGPVAHIDIDVNLSSGEGESKEINVDEIINNMSILRNTANRAYKNITKNEN